MPTIKGTTGDESLAGSPESDRLFGLDGNDELFGGAGNDILSGGDGIDLLRGGPGNDRFVASEGTDLVDGGEGNDTLDLRATGEDGAFASLVDGIALWSGGRLAISSVESVVGGNGHDEIYGSEAANRLNGGQGDDLLVGLEDVDVLVGADGDDTLDGSEGADRVFGGNGADLMFGDLDDDRLYGGSDMDEIYGGFGNDHLRGGDGSDLLVGDEGDDRLYGGRGDDWLSTSTGRDLLVGGNGADVFIGATYFLDPGLEGQATALDFARGKDKLLLDDFLLGSGAEQFALLDSNGNGRLDRGDAHVDLEAVTFGGITKASLVLDLGTFAADVNEADGFQPGQYTLTLYGVGRIEADDFFA